MGASWLRGRRGGAVCHFDDLSDDLLLDGVARVHSDVAWRLSLAYRRLARLLHGARRQWMVQRVWFGGQRSMYVWNYGRHLINDEATQDDYGDLFTCYTRRTLHITALPQSYRVLVSCNTCCACTNRHPCVNARVYTLQSPLLP